MGRPQLTIFFDIVSPFAYMACYLVNKSPVFKQCDVRFVPALLGGVMKACGNTAPVFIKNKDKWINLERKRHAKSFSIPINDRMPDGFPMKTISVMRHLCALSDLSPSQVPSTALALWHHLFVERRPVNEPADFLPVFEKVIGKNLTQEVAEAAGKSGKEILTKNSNQAVEDGAFGFPWFMATNSSGSTEAFWGLDHLGQVIDHLGLDRSEGSSGGWRSML